MTTEKFRGPLGSWLLVLFGLAVLAALAYAPAQRLPFISDDYVHIAVAKRFGHIGDWPELARDPLYRFRALSSVVAYWVERMFGMSPLAFNLTSLASHILCTWLVAALGVWKRIGWRVSIPAAAFFAVAEGHQEAVVWFAAIPELQVFAFTIAALLLWIRWLQSEPRRHSFYAGSLACFLLALMAKESAVSLVALQFLVLAVERSRRWRDWLSTTPMLALSTLYFAIIYSTRTSHQHFNDGTFSLTAPFLLVVVNSTARMMWIWGFAAAAVVFAFSRRAAFAIMPLALGWMIAGLLPYSFLTYMARVPSRHTYLASAGLAILVGAAFALLLERSNRRLTLVAAALVLTHNVSYLWVRKQAQFTERASPTTELVRAVRSTDGPVTIECFPYAQDVAVEAVRLEAPVARERLKFRLQPGCSGFRYVVGGSEPEPRPSRALIAGESGVTGNP